VELTESLLSKAAGWDVMKRARAYLAQGQVLSSYWAPPLLRGVVQAGDMSFRASMVIKSEIDIENLCTCRDAREWGKICAHVVGVGLHWLKAQQPETGTSPAARPSSSIASVPAPPPKKVSALRRDPAGEPAELFVILPPNLDQALARGKVMLVLESKWSGGRCPLNMLPKHRAYAFSSADQAILERIEALADGETPAVMQIPGKDFISLLPLMADYPNITLGKAQQVTVTKAAVKLPLRVRLEDNGEIVLSLKGSGVPWVQCEDWVWQNNSFQPLGLPSAIREVVRAPVRVSRAQVPQFLNQLWPQLQAGGAIETNFKLEDFTLEPQTPRFMLELKGGLGQLSGLLQCGYGSRIMTVGVTASDEAVWLPDPEVPTRYSTRNLDAERAALARLQHQGFTGPDSQGKLQLLGQNAVLNFFAREFSKLQREWTVTLEERLERSTSQNIERIEPQFQITPSGVQWFDLGVVFSSTGGQTFSSADIQRLLLSGQGYTRLKNGKMAVIDTGAVEELQEVLRDCAPQQHGQGYRINNTQAGFLDSTLRQNDKWRVQAPAAWRDRAAKQSGEAKLECPPLEDLETVLRPYQKHGVAWLHFLRENQFGGILADEMGLGKTLQTLAFLRTVRRQTSGLPPVLIVCPTSLVFNWVAEAKKFTPSLKVLPLQGPERQARFADIPHQDLVVTSYALIRRDAERYRELE
ncbi:MAG TPA: SNF2-related protein, partial [Clostridia bacterium]|nr:SNF2-related protein [Clostridia bacterium]